MSPRIYVTEIVKPNEGARLLWAAIKAAGSQAALADKLDVYRSYVSRWLRGEQKPRLAMRRKLEAYYGIPLDAWDDAPRKTFSLPAHAA